MPADRREFVRKPARHALERVMPVGGADHRANEGKLVGEARNSFEDLANLDPRHTRLNGTEFTTDLFGGFGFDVPEILMRWPTAQKNVNHSLMTAAGGALRRLGPEHVGQRERSSSD